MKSSCLLPKSLSIRVHHPLAVIGCHLQYDDLRNAIIPPTACLSVKVLRLQQDQLRHFICLFSHATCSARSNPDWNAACLFHCRREEPRCLIGMSKPFLTLATARNVISKDAWAACARLRHPSTRKLDACTQIWSDHVQVGTKLAHGLGMVAMGIV